MFLEKPSDGTRNGNGKVFLFCTVLVPPLRWSLIIINIIRRCVASTAFVLSKERESPESSVHTSR